MAAKRLWWLRTGTSSRSRWSLAASQHSSANLHQYWLPQHHRSLDGSYGCYSSSPAEDIAAYPPPAAPVSPALEVPETKARQQGEEQADHCQGGPNASRGPEAPPPSAAPRLQLSRGLATAILQSLHLQHQAPMATHTILSLAISPAPSETHLEQNHLRRQFPLGHRMSGTTEPPTTASSSETSDEWDGAMNR